MVRRYNSLSVAVIIALLPLWNRYTVIFISRLKFNLIFINIILMKKNTYNIKIHNTCLILRRSDICGVNC